MGQNKIIKQENEVLTGEIMLGENGDRLRSLAKDVLAEIDTKWDEKKMAIIRANGDDYLAKVKATVINTAVAYEEANNLLLEGASYLKTGAGFIDPFVESMHKPWKSACDIRKQFKDPIEEGKKILTDKIITWRQAEKRRVEAEQRKLDEERRAKEDKERREAQERERKAREKADEEKKKAAAKAEELLLQAEIVKVAAEELLLQAEIAKAAGDHEEAAKLANQAQGGQEEAAKLANQAQNENDRGAVAEAKQLAKAEEHAVTAESVYIAPNILSHSIKKTETTAGGSIPASKTWKVEIIDELELVKAVARGILDGGLPITCLNLDLTRVEAGIRRWAEVNQIKIYERNGIKVEEWEKLQARTSTGKKKGETK